MERLWSPWRIGYVADSSSSEGEKECIFCANPAAGDDESTLILHRARKAYIMMNLYPYNNGHLMVVPFRHVGELEVLQEREMLELMELSVLGIEALKEEMHPAGFNLGLNLGKVAGAGFAGHLHIHIVPRWDGDTNFMPVTADTKVIAENLKDAYKRLHTTIQKIL
jgi:ATP adenylyltransferase